MIFNFNQWSGPSKIGWKMSVNIENVTIKNFTAQLLQNFKHLAEQKDCFSCE
jgi:hypothetical protein